MAEAPDGTRAFDAWSFPAGFDGCGAGSRLLDTADDVEVARRGEIRIVDLSDGDAVAVGRALRSARTSLQRLGVREIAEELGAVGARFSVPGDPLREEALSRMPSVSGYSPEMCAAILAGMAPDWTEAALMEMVRADLGGPDVLDGFVERDPGCRSMAVGAPLSVHITAGTVPGVSVTSLLRSLMTKSPVFLKPGRGDVVLPVLFARALAHHSPRLSGALAVVYWPGGDPAFGDLERAIVGEADLVVVYGGDETVRRVRDGLDPSVPIVAYHHRVSIGVVGAEAVRSEAALDAAARATARAVSLFDQRGCVSPQALFLESTEAGPVEIFLNAMARHLERLAIELPSGRIDPGEAAELQQLRGSAELEAATRAGAGLRSGGREPWTVIAEPEADARLVPSCLNRVLRVYRVDDLRAVEERLEPLRNHLQTVGYCGVSGERLDDLGKRLARVGALRVAPMDRVAFPPPSWHHDGHGALEPLIRWVDLETGSTPVGQAQE